jgi:hypothetical protein
MSARSMWLLFFVTVLVTIGGCQNPGRFQALHGWDDHAHHE